MSHEPSPCGQCGRKDCPVCFPLPARREVPWAGELRLEVDRQMRALQAKEKAAVRDAVLEEAARVADKADRDCATQEWTAETIRALKATPAPITPSAVDEAAGSDPLAPYVCMGCAHEFAKCPDFDAYNCPLCGEKVRPKRIGLGASAVDEAERRGAERATAQVVAFIEQFEARIDVTAADQSASFNRGALKALGLVRGALLRCDHLAIPPATAREPCTCGTNAQHAPTCPSHPGYRPATESEAGHG